MAKRKIVFSFMFLLAAAFAFETACAQVKAREKVIEFMRSAGLDAKLDAPVKISIADSGVICIADKGDFFNQYVITEPAVSADAAVVMDSQLDIPSSCTKAVIVTHGWIDKGSGDWPADIAGAINQRIDPNEWVCAFFDWTGGAAVMNPLDAAKYGRDVAGARLAKAVLKLGAEFKHVHLIAHSAGCWAIDDAAKRIVSQTGAEIHLTFLDAYVPPFWNQSDLGNFEGAGWAEHYYTKDITLAATHTDLSAAHNVDITAIDGAVPEHEFPYRWYYATVAGRYRPSDREKSREVVTGRGDIDYGFERSLEAGQQNWSKSLTLKKGQKAVQFGKDKKK